MSDDSKAGGLKVVWGFRTTVDDKQYLDDVISESGMGTSEFFRETLGKRKFTVIKKCTHHEHALFLMNKTSNNINQLARAVNIDLQNGYVSPDVYRAILEVLSANKRLMQNLVEAIKNDSKN